MGSILGWILLKFGAGTVSNVIGYLESKTVQETERQRIAALYGSSIMLEAMKHKIFWIPWGIAAVSMSLWFAWGMLDTLANGALPDVAAIPPGLLPYAQTVWANIFWVGGTVVSVSTVSKTIGQAISSIFRSK